MAINKKILVSNTAMKEITLEVKKEKYQFFMELVKSFDFVSVKNQNKKKLILQIARAMKQASLAANGKIKSRPAKSLLNEL